MQSTWMWNLEHGPNGERDVSFWDYKLPFSTCFFKATSLLRLIFDKSTRFVSILTSTKINSEQLHIGSVAKKNMVCLDVLAQLSFILLWKAWWPDLQKKMTRRKHRLAASHGSVKPFTLEESDPPVTRCQPIHLKMPKKTWNFQNET